TARKRDRANAALERRDPLFERSGRRVHDPRVRVAVLLQVEVGGRRLGVLEDVAGGLEDRLRAGAGVRIRALPGVHLPRVEAPLALAHRKERMCGAWLSASSRKASWPYEVWRDTCLTSFAAARRRRSSSSLSSGGYIQSELNESRRKRACASGRRST